jgi:hypothetical protein
MRSIVLITAALSGAVLTSSSISSQGFLVALLGAPAGGTLCAALAAAVLIERDAQANRQPPASQLLSRRERSGPWGHHVPDGNGSR